MKREQLDLLVCRPRMTAEVPRHWLQTIEGPACLLQVLEEVEEILLDPSELDATHWHQD